MTIARRLTEGLAIVIACAPFAECRSRFDPGGCAFSTTGDDGMGAVGRSSQVCKEAR